MGEMETEDGRRRRSNSLMRSECNASTQRVLQRFLPFLAYLSALFAPLFTTLCENRRFFSEIGNCTTFRKLLLGSPNTKYFRKYSLSEDAKNIGRL